jgi:hypothetical protein
MRNFVLIFLVSLSLVNFSCKKGYTVPYIQALLDSTHVLQTITYKVQNTKPSPYDLMKNTPLADSVTYNYNRIIGNPDFLQNYNSGFVFSPFGTGFGFNLGTLIAVSYTAIPQFPASFEQGKVYENSTDFDVQNGSVFVALNGDYSAGDFYFTDSIPPDGKDPLVSGPDRASYCKILIDKKYVLKTQEGDMKLMDGTISGYVLLSYGLTNHTKYVQRRDYSVSFTSLHFYQN